MSFLQGSVSAFRATALASAIRAGICALAMCQFASAGVIIIIIPPSGVNSGYRAAQIEPRAQGDAIYWFRYENSTGPQYHSLHRLHPAGFVDDHYNSQNSLGGFALLTNGAVAVADDALGLRRLTPDGPIDPGFICTNLTAGYFSVRALAGYQDNRLLVSGAEQALDGDGNTIWKARTFRIQTNGVNDAAYNPEPLKNKNAWARRLHIRRTRRVLASLESSQLTTPELVAMKSNGAGDSSFQMNSTVRHNVEVSRIIERNDGCLLIAGRDLSTTGSVVVCVRTNGSLYSTFASGGILRPAGTRVHDIALAANDGFYAVLEEPGVANNVHRFNADGSSDPTFAVALDVNALCVGTRDTNSVWIGGYFNHVDGVSHPYAAKLDPNGRLYPPTPAEGFAATDVCAWKATLRWDASPRATHYYLERSTNGVDGWETVHLKGVNGTRGPVDNGHLILPPDSVDGRAVFSFVDGPLLGMGDLFYRIGVSNRTGAGGYSGPVQVSVPRYTTTWEVDPAFQAQTGGEGKILALAATEDGGVIAGGSFATFGAASCTNVARVLPTGTRDPAFVPPLWYGDGEVDSVLTCSGGQIFIGGSFFNQATSTRQVALLETNGATNFDFDLPIQAFSGPVRTMSRQQDGKIILGGGFKSHSLIPVGIARIHWTAGGWSFDTNFSGGSGVSDTVNAVAIEPDGDVLIGGEFSSLHGVARSNIARLKPDGTLDTTFIGSVDGPVNALSLLPDGTLLIGGSFRSVGGQPASALARLLPDGALDAAFASPIESNITVHAILREPDGRIFVGGAFQQWSGTPAGCLVRLMPDGSVDPSFDVGTGISSGEARALSQDVPGRLLVGGDFSSFNGVAKNDLVRLIDNTPDGPPDTPAEFFAQTGRIGLPVVHWSPVERGLGPRGYVIQGSPNGIDGWTTAAFVEGDATFLSPFIGPNAFLGSSYLRIASFSLGGMSEWSPAIPAAAAAFVQWKYMWGVEGASGPEEDALALNYALGMGPFKYDVGRLPRLGLVNGSLNFSFARARNEVTYIVESSTNLTDWSAIYTLPPTTYGPTNVVVGPTTDMSAFWRLRAVVPDQLPGDSRLP